MACTLKLPVGIDSFEKIRRNRFYYIDKTKLIEQLVETGGEVTLFTRPRRFGKTLNMSMLKAFFETGADESLFDGLYIAQNKALCEEHMGKYPVIFLSLKSVPLDGNLLLDNDAINLMEGFSPVYISSITYGRMGVITMESNYGYNEVRLAVKAAFDAKIVNGNISISNEYKKIIDESNIKIYMVGGDGSGIAESVEGFAAFKKYIIDGGYYSPEVPGVPIAFTASYLMDNSPVYTKFKINIPN